LPESQRQLITLVLRKLLASSTFAIAATLSGMANRLEADLKRQRAGGPAEGEVLPDDDFEQRAELEEEYSLSDDEGEQEPDDAKAGKERPIFESRFIASEAADLRRFAAL
jgi:hypothetical protein